jgi:hypothetical protein
MYGQLGYGDSDEYGDDLDGVLDVFQRDVMGVPVWALTLGAVGLLAFTKPGKRLLGAVGLGGKAAKKNPKRRRSRKAKHNRRRRSRR